MPRKRKLDGCQHPASRLYVWEAIDVVLVDGEWEYVPVWCFGCCVCGHGWTSATLLKGSK